MIFKTQPHFVFSFHKENGFQFITREVVHRVQPSFFDDLKAKIRTVLYIVERKGKRLRYLNICDLFDFTIGSTIFSR